MSQEGEILAAVAVDLRAINGQAPYSYQVKFVSEDLLFANNMPDLPGVIISDVGSTFENWAPPMVYCLLAVELEGVIHPIPESVLPVRRQILNFVSELRYAMIGPDTYTHNGTCIHSYFDSFDVFPVVANQQVGCRVRFNLQYAFPDNEP